MVSVNNPVVIFTFHHISPYKDILTVSPELFRKTLRYIKNEFNIISYEDFTSYLFKNGEIPEKSAMITIDDGYLDNYIYAYPIIKEFEIPTKIFLITDMIKIGEELRDKIDFKPHREIERDMDSKHFLNLLEAKDMVKSGLISFDSHSKTHYSCFGENHKKIKSELNDSFKFIERYFPKEYYSFCWPKGRFNEVSLNLIKDSNYSLSFSTIDGAFTKGEDIFKIKRVDISSNKNGDEDYLNRVKKKSKLYSIPIISKLYSDFKYFKRKRL